MPERNSVPSLKLLCIRTIAWPDALPRSTREAQAPPLAATGTSRTKSKTSLFSKFLGKKGPNKSKTSVRQKYVLSCLSQVGGLSDAIVNAWIRMSNYNGSRIDQLKQMERYLSMRNVSVLDFMHEESILRSGMEWADIAGLVPANLIPQCITPAAWIDIAETLRNTGNAKSMRTLFIPFAPHHRPADFQFTRTISNFQNLTKIVVTGSLNDNFMKAVGISCDSLAWLDIRGCPRITETGVLLLLFKRDPQTVKASILTNLLQFGYPSSTLRPLTKTLQYFDMSTVPVQDTLLDIPEIAIKACPQLVATSGRLLYYPGGHRVFLRRIGMLTLQEIKIKILSDVRCLCIETLVILVQMVRKEFLFGLTQIELRSDRPGGEECGFLFLYMFKVIMHVVVENLTVVNVTTFTTSVFNFIPLETLAQHTPYLRHIKASLKGQLTREHPLPALKSVTTPMIYSTDTLKSLILFCFELEYLEVREIFTSTNGGQLNDYDIHEMMLNGPYPSLEVIRFLFYNQATLVP